MQILVTHTIHTELDVNQFQVHVVEHPTRDVMFQSLKAVCPSSMAMPPIPAENSVSGQVKLCNQQGTDDGHSTIPSSIKSQTDQYFSITSGVSAFCVIFF